VHKIVVEIKELETCHKFVDNWNNTYVPRGFFNKHGWESCLDGNPNPFSGVCGLNTSCHIDMKPY
jgi:hypothetical protein